MWCMVINNYLNICVRSIQLPADFSDCLAYLCEVNGMRWSSWNGIYVPSFFILFHPAHCRSQPEKRAKCFDTDIHHPTQFALDLIDERDIQQDSLMTSLQKRKEDIFFSFLILACVHLLVVETDCRRSKSIVFIQMRSENEDLSLHVEGSFLFLFFHIY